MDRALRYESFLTIISLDTQQICRHRYQPNHRSFLVNIPLNLIFIIDKTLKLSKINTEITSGKLFHI